MAHLFLGLYFTITSTAATTLLTLQNDCSQTIWPGVISGNGAIYGDGSSPLTPGQTAQLTAQPGWSGRIWARTGCSFDGATGNGHCTTGDCAGNLVCTTSGQPPATLAEFTIGSPDFYDISLVDGYNVGLAVRARGGPNNCRSPGCSGDINAACPPELRVVAAGGAVVACKSACLAFGTHEACCTGAHSNPDTCRANPYSRIFKSVCPEAYSYAFDDRSSLCTCSGSDYVVTFCPSREY